MNYEWDDFADDWELNSNVVLYAERAFETLKGAVNLKNIDVLDFGCGTGLLTQKIAPNARQVVAVDTSEKMISKLRAKNLANVTTLPINLSEETINSSDALHQKFDLIVASSVFSFVPNYQETLSLLRGLLAPKGMLVQWDWLSTGEEGDVGLTRQAIEAALLKAGFSSSNVTHPFSMESEKGDMEVLMGIAIK